MSLWDELVDMKPLREALYDIQKDIDAALELIAKNERQQTIQSHANAALALSGVEIKMTNFASDLRKKFTANAGHL